MSISAFGVEHTDVSKGEFLASGKPGSARYSLTYGGVKDRYGKGAKGNRGKVIGTYAKHSVLNQLGGASGGAALGAGIGGAIAAGKHVNSGFKAAGGLKSKALVGAATGAYLGSIGGAYRGEGKAALAVREKGYIKKSAFGVEHDVDKAFGAGFATGAKNLVAGAKNLGAKALKPLNSASYIPKSGTIGGKTFGTPGSTMKITSGQKKIGAGVGAGALGAGAFGMGNKRNY